LKKNKQKFLWIIGLVLIGFGIVACQNKTLPDTHMHNYDNQWICGECGDLYVANLAAGSKGVAGTQKITGLDPGKFYRVLVDDEKMYVNAAGELTENLFGIGALTDTEITGLTNRTATYNVIEAALFEGSLDVWDHTGEGNMPNNEDLAAVTDGKLTLDAVQAETTFGINLALSVDKTYEIVRLGDNPWGKTRVSAVYDYAASFDIGDGHGYWIPAGATEAARFDTLLSDAGLWIVTDGGNPPWLDGMTYVYTPNTNVTTLGHTYVVLANDGTFKVLTVEVVK